MTRITVAILSVLALVTTGCGGDGTPAAGRSTPPSTSTGSPPPPAKDHGTVDISSKGAAVDLTLELRDNYADRSAAQERYFEPTFIKVAPGQTITVRLANRGELPHTFTIVSPDVNTRLSAGDQATAVVKMPQSGDVAFFCRLHAHLGMWGVFFFGSAPAATPTPY